MSAVTHRDLCRAAASWLLHDCRCYAAVHELGVHGGQVDAIGITLPEPEAEAALRARQAESRRTRAAERLLELEAGADPVHPGERWTVEYLTTKKMPPPPKASRPRVVVVEVKRTRSDLLADLRAQKLRAYEATATNAYLLVVPDVFLAGPDRESAPAATERRLADLDTHGLPPGWGVLLAHVRHRENVSVGVIRKSRPLREADPDEVRLWGAYMLRSMSYRVVRRGPMRAEHDQPEDDR